MFMFVDGRPVVLSFALVEGLYYKAFMAKFPDAQVSITQWRGSYEYQAIYPDIQMIVETGVITQDAMDHIGQSIVQANEAIHRPACLYSRVPERFKELGFEATIRIATEATKGTVAICVDQERVVEDYGSTVTPASGGTEYPNEIGWRLGKFGAMTDQVLFGRQIRSLTTMTTAPDIVYLDFQAEYTHAPFVATIGGIAVTFTQTGPGSGSYTGPSAEAYALIRASAGVNILVEVADGSTVGVGGSDDVIAAVIRDEMLPGGQWMEGNIVYPTAISNGQPIDIKWAVPVDTPYNFRATITRKRGSPYPEQTVDQIIELFNANFDEQMGIGTDITPNTYLTVRDLPWASSVLVEWSDGTNWRNDDETAYYSTRYLANMAPANVVIQ